MNHDPRSAETTNDEIEKKKNISNISKFGSFPNFFIALANLLQLSLHLQTTSSTSSLLRILSLFLFLESSISGWKKNSLVSLDEIDHRFHSNSPTSKEQGVLKWRKYPAMKMTCAMR